MIVESDGVSSAIQITYCDGMDPTIKANRYCIVPMTAIVAAPYLLEQGHNNIFATV